MTDRSSGIGEKRDVSEAISGITGSKRFIHLGRVSWRVERKPNEQISRSLIDRLMRRQKAPSGTGPTVERSTSTGTPLMFETLEPRLLLAADLTAGYAFNEASGTSAADASGHSIVGTLVNGPTFTTGKYSNAVSLDGVNDYVNLGNPSALQLTGSMTVSAWINSSSFPGDDAAIVSKRGNNEIGFQLDTTVDKGPRTIGFKLTDSSGGQMFRYGATALQPNTWYYVTGVYNATTQTLDVYLNGQLDNGQLQGTVTTSQQNSTSNVTIGRRSGMTGFEFAGRIDDVRIYSRALTLAEIQADMATPLTAGVPTPDTTFPTVALTAPAANAAVAGTVTVSATASDNIGVVGVQFLLDGTNSWSRGYGGPLQHLLEYDGRIERFTYDFSARARCRRQCHNLVNCAYGRQSGPYRDCCDQQWRCRDQQYDGDACSLCK